jgi:hypothetical protein
LEDELCVAVVGNWRTSFVFLGCLLGSWFVGIWYAGI